MKVLKGFGIFFAVIYSILFFIVFTAYMLFCSVTNVFKESFYVNIVENIDLDKIKMVDLDIVDEDIIGDKTTSVEDYIIDELENNGVDNNTANKIVSNKKIREVIGSTISGTIQYLLYNDDMPKIDVDDINQIIDEIGVRQEFNNSDVNINEIVNEFNNILEEELQKESNKSDNNEIENLKTISSFVNSSALWITLALDLVLSYLFLSLLTWSFKKPLNYLGIPILIAGLLFLILRFSFGLILQALVNIDITAFSSLIGTILFPILIIGIICTISGITLIVVRSLLKNKDIKDEPNFDIEEQNKQ